jgi:pSer/pThr/pTyr-binding forkhead associated (FHA) protein
LILDDAVRSATISEQRRFLDQHPDPVLIFFVAFTRDQERVDTPEGGSPKQVDARKATTKLKTDIQPDLSRKTTMGKTQEGGVDRVFRLVGDSEVIALRKSDRNPFDNMITVGRAPNNDVWLPLPSVSKVHAYFSRNPAGGWRLTDQNATNGTTVDEKMMTAGASMLLYDGAVIDFGPDIRAKYFGPEGLFRFLLHHRPAQS